MNLTRLIVFGSIAVVVFDVIASIASMVLSVPYASFSIGSILIYAVAGYVAARLKPLHFSAWVGGLIGLVDATIGWAISWKIGPGKIEDLPDATTISSTAGAISLVVFTIIFAVIFATICGLIGGLVAKLKNKLAHNNA